MAGSICNNSTFVTILYWLFYLLNLFSLIMPILLMLLISFDMFRAVVSFEESEFENTTKRIGRRIVFLVLIFFVPTIINFVFITFTNIDYKENACVKNDNLQAISKLREGETLEKAKQKLLFDERLEEDRKKKAEEEQQRILRRQEILKEEERISRNLKNKRELKRQAKDKRNREFEEQSFENVEEGSIYVPDCEGGDCGTTGFFQRYSKPTRGTKYFPELSGTLLGQCVWYARGRAQEIVATSSLSQAEKGQRINALQNTMGNGGDWYTAAGLSIFKKSSTTPKSGSIVSWSNGSYGHVGIVEEVTSDGKCTITDGWRTRHGGKWRSGVHWEDVNFRRKTINCSNFNGFYNGRLNGFVYLLE